MMNALAGRDLVRKVGVAHRADVPLMLHGRHGVGKSELLAVAAKELGIELLVRDLSLMEPPDLVGMPEARDGRTHFRPPAALPTDGHGLLVLEELNRCPAYMRAPALQLLTARRLNDYVLPAGWLPVACVNDGADGYHVDDIDPALASRFAHVRVEPDVASWTAWARASGVHPAVVDLVAATPGVFSTPSSNPRSWTQAARIVSAWEQGDGVEGDLVVLLAGVLDEAFAHALVRTYRSRPNLPTVLELVDDYRKWRPEIKTWVKNARLDVLAATWSSLRDRLVDDAFRTGVSGDPGRAANVATFARDLPGDLRRDALAWLSQNGLATPDGGGS